MVDATSLIVLATVAQTIVITITLVVFILQFRSQEKAIHESSYQNLMGRYNDVVMLQASRDKPSQILINRMARLSKGNTQITPEDAELVGHLLVIYGILEEAFILHKRKWIDDETWGQWAAWLSAMAEIPQFMAIHDSSQGMFDKGFEDLLTKIAKEKNQNQPSPNQNSDT